MFGNIHITNLLSIDLEDWYMDADISAWSSYEDRIVDSTNKLLVLLRSNDTKATFFVLGYVAEHHPELILKIKDEGHEIASHGYSHKSIKKLTKEEFNDDVSKSIKILEEITHNKILGFRACQFSITKETAWAVDILKKNGVKYDSSIFPIKTSLYGVPDAPLFPYYVSSSNIARPSSDCDLLEIPPSVYPLPLINFNVPVAGGFYLRFLPYSFIKHAIKRLNKKQQIAVVYLHPWEIDPDQPKIGDFKWYHYYNLGSTEQILKKLLSDFKFCPISEWMLKNNYK